MKTMKKIFKMKNILKMTFVLGIFMTVTLSSFAYGYYYDDDYPEIENAYWDNKTARWDVSGYANSYELVLYKDGHRVVTKTATRESLNLSQYLSRGSGDYYFDVRPYNRRTGWGNWVGSNTEYFSGYHYDDGYYYDDRYYDSRYNHKSNNDAYRYPSNNYNSNNDISYAKNQGPPVNNSNQASIIVPPSNQQTNQNEGAIAYNKQTITVPAPIVIYQQANGESSLGSFVEVYGIWYFVYQNGVKATNAWVQYKNKWYYIDVNGIMAVGLYTINGSTYFLSEDGSMTVGSIVIDGINHYFDNNGVMIY